MARTQSIFAVGVFGAAAVCAACISLPSFGPPSQDTGSGNGATTGSADPGTTPYDGSLPGASPSPSSTGSNTPTTGNPVPRSTWLHQQQGHLYDPNNQEVLFRGIGWYGFESSSMLNRAAIPNRLGSDVVTVMQRLHLMGFNIVNIGISFSRLYNADGSRIMNPTTVALPCAGDSKQSTIINSVTLRPSQTLPGGFGPAPTTPLLSNVPAASDGMCNDYLPDLGEPVVARLAAIVDIFTRNGFYVLLQENLDQDKALANSAGAFAIQWKSFVQDLIAYGGAYEGMAQPSCTSGNPNVTALALCHNVVLGLMSNIEDIDSPRLTWEPNQNVRSVGSHQLLAAAMAILPSYMPRAMFLISGSFQFGLSTTINGGVDPRFSGFPALAGPANVASAGAFFAEIVNQPLESRLMFGFNAWGPTWDTYLNNFVSNMPAKLQNDFDNSFGMLTTGGIVDTANNQHLFPSLPNAFGANPQDPNDNIFLAAMQNYMAGHNMPNFIWWCFNGSTSTHSALTDPNYYTALNPSVVAYLQALGLTPSQ